MDKEQMNAEPESTKFVGDLDNNKHDPILGSQVREHLTTLGLETMRPEQYDPEQAYHALDMGVTQAIHSLGLDRNDPSLEGTPKRYARMFIGELTKGLNYDFFPKCTTTPNGKVNLRGVILEGTAMRLAQPYEKPDAEVDDKVGAYNQMVLVDNIETISLCEHHLQTIDGVTHIAYIPNQKVLGLSKFARVTDFFARRPQIQERMTEQIYEALSFILETKDIAVVVRATHYCMKARGVLQRDAKTTTDRVGGRFFTEPSLRKEFFDAIRQ